MGGIDEELNKEVMEETTEKVVSFSEGKKKRAAFHIWTVAGEDYRMKLNTGMIEKVEKKYGRNILTLIMNDDIPPLAVMLTVVQAALSPWHHGMAYDDVKKLFDKWVNEGGSQMDLLSKVVIPTLAVSGFFTGAQAESILKAVEETEDELL